MTQRVITRRSLGATLLLAMIGSGLSAELEVALETIALSGETAPGTTDSFQLFAAAFINDRGDVAFEARLSPTNNESVWLWDSTSGLELLSRAGLLDIDDESLRVSNAGVAHGESETVVEIVAPDASGNPQVVASDGGTAPGGGTFDLSSTDEDEMALSNAGIFFETDIEDGSNLAALFRQDAGFSLQEIYREGDAAPGAGGDVFFDFVDGVMNDSGEVAFEAFLDLVGTRALFGPAAGGESELLRTGDAVPDVAGAQFRGFGAGPEALSINNAGSIAFQGNMLVGPGGVTGTSDTGVWGPSAGGSGFRLVARTGSAAPEVGGATFTGLDFVVLNAADSVAFEGNLEGSGIDTTNNTGLWAGRRDSALQLVVRDGDAAPGLPGEILAPATGFNFSLNGNDQLAFAAELDDGGAAIWLYDLVADAVSLVLGPGDSIEVDGGDVRVVETAWFGKAIDLDAHSGGEDGKKSVWNDGGEMAALVEFTDGTEGVFRLTVDTGTCTAPDGENLVLSDDTVDDVRVFEVCNTLTVGPNYQVAGPNGDLTLYAGATVALGNGVSVGPGGKLTAGNDPSP